MTSLSCGIRTLLLIFSCSLLVCASSPDDVKSLPGIGPLLPKTHAGFLLANQQYGAYLYYVCMESLSDPDNDPLILWLQGGPGTSSLFGAFVENGPYIIQPNGTWTWNQYAWNTNASVIWIDNPVGTGFSYVQNASGYVRHEKQVAGDLATALVAFMKLHPKFTKVPFFVFGESYGGKYAPWLAHTILSDPSFGLRLDGVGLGNGWVSPVYQTPSNPRYLYNHSLITTAQYASANVTLETYLQLLAAQRYEEAFHVDNSLFTLLCVQAGVTDAFDIRQLHDPTDPPYYALLRWLAEPAVSSALFVTGHTFSSGKKAYVALDDDEELASMSVLNDVLHKRPVLLYNGVCDLVCNYMGTEAYARELVWPGQQCYASTPETQWLLANGTLGGWVQAFGNLTRLVIANAGHMSPFDQPPSAHQMLYQWLSNAFGMPGQPCSS